MSPQRWRVLRRFRDLVHWLAEKAQEDGLDDSFRALIQRYDDPRRLEEGELDAIAAQREPSPEGGAANGEDAARG